MSSEIYVVASTSKGHLNSCIELSKHLLNETYKTTLVVPSTCSAAIPSSFLLLHPLLAVAKISADPQPREQIARELETHITKRVGHPNPTRIVCAIIDTHVGWTKEVFWKYNIPTVGFFTFGACAVAMELAAWRARVENMRPGEIRELSGLPKEMSLMYSDLKRGPRGEFHKLGDPPPWFGEIEGMEGLMFNTCDDLERPFLEYMTNQMGIPIWGVGPLLPEQYWKSIGSIMSDDDIRSTKRQFNYREEEVIEWLDSKPRGSVLYVSFGRHVGPTREEYPQLMAALEESTCPFIWGIQHGAGRFESDFFPCDMDHRVGDRDLIIHGLAPQLLILSHPSTGGILSYSGWNSTTEAIGRGVPFLAWPIRGDQYLNAKLIACHLKVGCMVSIGDRTEMVSKDDILNGIKRIMGDEEIRMHADILGKKFLNGFPTSSKVAFNDFRNFIVRN